MISINKTHTLIALGGFLAGTLGLKALQSDAAKRVAVQGVAAGMRVKSGYQDIVEQAKAQVDDIVAEANYLNEQDGAEAESCGCGCKAEAVDGGKAE